MALESGLGRLREIHSAVDDFYNGSILPAIGELAVTLSNAIAAEVRGAGLEQAVSLLSQIRSQARPDAAGQAAADGRGVLRLLE
jgi:uncharacterized protein YjaG (DUF416 family)